TQPTRAGYTFTGWNTASNGSGVAYSSGATYTGNAIQTLYAQWIANTYTVSYNGNSNTGGSVPSNSTATYNTPFTVAANSGSLVRTGYTFAGWNTLANGSGTTYPAGTGSFTFVDTANKTLYAQWTVNSYQVNYEPQGGSSVSSGTWTFGSTINLPTPTRTGYTFNGWSTTTSGFSPNNISGLYVRFRASDYNPSTKIWVDSSGNSRDITPSSNSSTSRSLNTSSPPALVTTTIGNGSTKSFAAVSGGQASWIRFGNPTKNGNYTVFTLARYSGAAKGRIFTGSGGNHLLGFWDGRRGVAHYDGWLGPSSSVGTQTDWLMSTGWPQNYRGNGSSRIASGGDSNVYEICTNTCNFGGEWTDYQIADFIFYDRTLTSDERLQVEDYLADLYGISNYTSNGTALNYTSTFTPNVAADLTFYAQWIPNTYSISFDANGGTGAPAGQIKTQDISLTLSSTQPTRAGYTFTWWNTASNGSGVAYSSGATYAGNAIQILYAQWSPNAYTVTYNGNSNTGGSVPSNGTATYNSTFTVAANSGSLVRTGYTFAGWNTLANGSGTTYPAGTGSFTFVDTATKTLYAQWNINSYTVTYNANSATSGSVPTAQTQNYNTSVAVPANTGSLARTGYTFGGWNTAADGSETNYTAGSGSFTLTADTTLYAKWTPNTYTVTYNGNSNTGGSVPSNGTATYNSTFTVAANSGTLVRTGYTFAGWNTLANGSGTTYPAGTGSFTFVDTANKTLYAQWNINSYTVTYNANSATSGSVPTAQTQNYNTSVTVPSNTG
ncbi:MAG: beta strand repeat-containing protein, partial [Bacteroidota bacterium]